MTYVLAAIAAVLAGAIGWFATAALTVWIAGAMGMSDFEGERGMFAFFAVGPLGGLLCMFIAAWLVLRTRAGRASIGRTALRLALIFAGIALVVRGAIWIRMQTLDNYTDTAPPTLEFEIRVPAAMTAADPPDLRVELHTDRNVGEGRLADRWSPADGDRKVIAGSVDLALKTSSRLLVVSFPDQPTRLFALPLARDPPTDPAPSAWRPANQLAARGEDAPRPAPADEPVQMRYRVRRAGDD